mmetsp:Transcript_16600/g.30813  ORF Transcript_16600/g.30813 Transcript_16600/m.30813 type:complete len:205 (+) Transcript_16600:1151-1765(+)
MLRIDRSRLRGKRSVVVECTRRWRAFHTRIFINRSNLRIALRSLETMQTVGGPVTVEGAAHARAIVRIAIVVSRLRSISSEGGAEAPERITQIASFSLRWQIINISICFLLFFLQDHLEICYGLVRLSSNSLLHLLRALVRCHARDPLSLAEGAGAPPRLHRPLCACSLKNGCKRTKCCTVLHAAQNSPVRTVCQSAAHSPGLT